MPKYRFYNKSIKRIDECVYPPVTQWLRAFMDSKFVVCDSFHGAVFSIIFNKPFLVIGNKKRRFSRFTSLLRFYGLEDCIISESKDVLTVVNRSFEWELINSKRKFMKEKSYLYMRQIN